MHRRTGHWHYQGNHGFSSILLARFEKRHGRVVFGMSGLQSQAHVCLDDRIGSVSTRLLSVKSRLGSLQTGGSVKILAFYTCIFRILCKLITLSDKLLERKPKWNLL